MEGKKDYEFLYLSLCIEITQNKDYYEFKKNFIRYIKNLEEAEKIGR